MKINTVYDRLIHISSISWKQISAGTFFLGFALAFGFIMIIVTPPFQVPDEINHFYKAYQISDGQFISIKHDNRLGGYIPSSIVDFTNSFKGLKSLNSRTSYRDIATQASTPLDKENLVFCDFPNTALYSPVSYIPQAIAISLLKLANCSPLVIFYGARIFTLLIWIMAIWLSIKITPDYKWLFAMLALLPMSLYINMSLSADVVTNIIAFLLVAFILRLCFKKQQINNKQFAILVSLGILIASAKIVYAPLLLLFLIIPTANFKNRKARFLKFTVLLTITGITALFWSSIINELYTPFFDYNSSFRTGLDLIKCANIHDQLDYILTHGIYIFNVFGKSLVESFDMYYSGYIGTFGWLQLKLSNWIIHLAYIITFGVAIIDKNEYSFNGKQKGIIGIAALATILLILLSQHLTWGCVGGDRIVTIQGRYFIPVFPILYLLFSNRMQMLKVNSKVIITTFSFLLLSYSCYIINERYFEYYADFKTPILCNAEELKENRYFVTSSDKVLLENGNARTDERSLSGKYSIGLSENKQYGFGYKLYGLHVGDKIDIKVWRKGDAGKIILAGNGGKDFYETSDNVIETNNDGWQLINLVYTLEKNMNSNEVGLVIFNKSKSISFFDDISIMVYKAE